MARRNRGGGAGSQPGRLADAVTLVGELVLVALLGAALCWPIITALPVVGVLQRRTISVARGIGIGGMWRRLGSALKWGWLPSLGVAALAYVALFNVSVVRTGAMPEAKFSAVLSVVVALCAAVVGLRGAASWEPGLTWRAALRAGARRCVADVTGSAILVVMLVACAMVVWLQFWAAIIVPGVVVWTLAIVESRRRVRQYVTKGSR